METEKNEIKSALLNFDSEKVKSIFTTQFAHQQEQIPSIIECTLQEIGEEWENGELALSQVYLSGMICEKVVDEIFPEHTTMMGDKSKIAIVTFNDHHALGKKIVMSVLKSVGFNIRDVGQGLTLEDLVSVIVKEKIEILLISVLMLHSALKIRELRQELNKRKYPLKILVGGAPFNFDPLLWKKVGADAMGQKPSDAVVILNDWLN